MKPSSFLLLSEQKVALKDIEKNVFNILSTSISGLKWKKSILIKHSTVFNNYCTSRVNPDLKDPSDLDKTTNNI